MRTRTLTLTLVAMLISFAMPAAFADDDDWDDDDRRGHYRHGGYVRVQPVPVRYDRVVDATRRLENSAENLFEAAREGGVYGGHPAARARAFDALRDLQFEARRFEEFVEGRRVHYGSLGARYDRVEFAAERARNAILRVGVSGRVLRSLERVERDLYRVGSLLGPRAVHYDYRGHVYRDCDDECDDDHHGYDYHGDHDRSRVGIGVGVDLPNLRARVVLRDDD